MIGRLLDNAGGKTTVIKTGKMISVEQISAFINNLLTGTAFLFSAPRDRGRLIAAPWRFLLLALVVGLARPLIAQRVGNEGSHHGRSSIKGVVLLTGQQGKSTALEGIEVKLATQPAGGQSFSALTDSEGRFQFKNLSAGSYLLEIQMSGFKPFNKRVDLGANEDRDETIHLQLQEVVQKVEVRDRAGLVPVQGSTQQSTTFHSQQFMELPLAQEKFKDALPMAPGVVRTDDGKLNFKGVSESQGMLLVNSVETVDPVTGSFSIPIPVDDIQKLNVQKGPYNAQYGNFSGGLTTIRLKPPPGQWNYGVMDFLPSLRGKNGHLVGIGAETPRTFFGGPILRNKLNFSEALTYEVRKKTVRGQPWPHDETKTQGFDSLTSFQAILSPRQVLMVNVNGFSHREQFADINSLVPQTASSDLSNRGFSIGGNDNYQFNSGALLNTILHFTRFGSNAHGQGSATMLVTPDGWGGNFFNAWYRTANEYEALSTFQFPQQEWYGHHRLKLGVDFTHRSYTGRNLSHPIELLREDSSVAEQINFLGLGLLGSADSGVAEFLQDHWILSSHLAMDLGGRLLNQSEGRSAAFSPRAGLVYSPGTRYKTVIRAGAGLFYGPVPMLAEDFTDNPKRVLTYFSQDGTPLGPAITLKNAYLQMSADGGLTLGGPGVLTGPQNFTWNFEVDRRIWPHAMLRLGYLYSRTKDIFVETPWAATPDGTPFLGLAPAGGAHYHEFEASIHFQPSEKSQLNVSYTRSRARGDLNSLADIEVPFEQPVIRPNVTSNLPSDIPNRLVAWGVFNFPWNLTASPVLDVHSGYPYSYVDTLEDYVGDPNGRHFPAYLSLDLKVYRTLRLPLPFLKNRKVHLGVYSLNLTNHSNPGDVYNNIASPYFGHFAGFRHRVNGFALDVVE